MTQPELAVSAKGGMKKTLTLWNFFTIGFGAIIGTGWVLLVGDWMILGGGPIAAIIAFLLGACFLLPIGAVFGELTSAIPISGGIVEYVDRTFGHNVSYITGWFLALGNAILCPWEAIAISTLLSEMFGSLPGMGWLRAVKLYSILGADVFLFPTLISLAIAGYVIYLNFRGASSAAKLQAFLTKALLGGMLLAMVISFIKGSPMNILPTFEQVQGPLTETSAGGMFAGIISVLVITPFFYAGFDTIPQQAEEAAEGLDWKKFGRIISMALLASGVFYTICIYSFGTIIPWTEFVQSAVPALAVLKTINMVLYIAMLVIATLGPMGPMNSFFGATSRILLAMGRKKQLPPAFAKLDAKTGTPVTANILMAVFTLLGPFMGKKMLVPLTEVSALAFILACTVVSLACLKMRTTEPDLPRPYKVPGGKFGIGLAVLAGAIVVLLLVVPGGKFGIGLAVLAGAIVVLLLVVPGSPASLTTTGWLVVGAWILIGLALKLSSDSVNRKSAA